VPPLIVRVVRDAQDLDPHEGVEPLVTGGHIDIAVDESPEDLGVALWAQTWMSIHGGIAALYNNADSHRRSVGSFSGCWWGRSRLV
jgi:hypothetical protein